MIEFSLTLAKEFSLRAHVITRQNKVTLIDHLNCKMNSEPYWRDKLTIQTVGETADWPDTLLHSEDYWTNCNVVFLPDMDFSPISVLPQVFSHLDSGCPAVFATFMPDNNEFSSWGVVDVKSGAHCEKPRESTHNSRAWGLFGFRKDFGKKLLQNMLASTKDHQWCELPTGTEFLELNCYKDLTRS